MECAGTEYFGQGLDSLLAALQLDSAPLGLPLRLFHVAPLYDFGAGGAESYVEPPAEPAPDLGRKHD